MELENLSDEELRNLYHKTKERKEYEESMSYILKILLNSFYGSNALSHNPFSNGKLTNASVTITGRMWIQLVGMTLSNKVRELLGEEPTCYLTEIVQGDTDSQYLSLDRLIEKEMPDASEEEILEYIQDFYENVLKDEIKNLIVKMADQFNFCNPEILKMDQEVITTSFCSIASKRYFCRVNVNDGNKLSTPKEKVVGVSLVSKSTSKGVKEILRPVISYILNHEEKGMQKYIEEQRNVFLTLDPINLSRSLSVADVESYKFMSKNNTDMHWKDASKLAKYVSEKNKWQTAPVNSKGAYVFNHLIVDEKLDEKYEKIGNLDRVFLIYLMAPNIKTGNNGVICFKDPSIFKDADLKQYIDYDKQWEKEVIGKIKILTDIVGWNIEPRVTLDDW